MRLVTFRDIERYCIEQCLDFGAPQFAVVTHFLTALFLLLCAGLDATRISSESSSTHMQVEISRKKSKPVNVAAELKRHFVLWESRRADAHGGTWNFC